MPAELIAEVETWAIANDASRSEAFRRLVEIGLSKTKPSQRPQVLSTAKQSAARAVELAGNAIDKHSDQTASDDERKVRKRKLIQGPSVFRDARKDRPSK
jgi:metal-responsive CopG/Arc/MetJ family transcriptional regulator